MIWILAILLLLWLLYKVTKWSLSSPPLPVKQEEPDVWVTLTGSVEIDDDLADELDGINIDDTNDIHFEIDAWLSECKRECRYVIIDDLEAYNFNEHQMPYLLCVNPFDGLTEEIADRAIEILGINNKTCIS